MSVSFAGHRLRAMLKQRKSHTVQLLYGIHSKPTKRSVLQLRFPYSSAEKYSVQRRQTLSPDPLFGSGTSNSPIRCSKSLIVFCSASAFDRTSAFFLPQRIYSLCRGKHLSCASTFSSPNLNSFSEIRTPLPFPSSFSRTHRSSQFSQKARSSKISLFLTSGSVFKATIFLSFRCALSVKSSDNGHANLASSA